MKLLLCGGGSAEKTIEANKKFNEIIDHNKPLLYIPLAIEDDSDNYEGCLEWIKKELSEVNIPSIEMVRSFTELANKNYNNYCALFIGGGNTFKLLKGLKDSGSFEKIREYINNGGIVYGGSAGAIIFGYDINSCLIMDDNEVKLEDTKGFNVLDGKSLFAHYTNEYTPKGHEKFKKYLIDYSSTNEDVIALPEEDTIFIDSDKRMIIGNKEYYEFVKGHENKIDNYICKIATLDEMSKKWDYEISIATNDKANWLQWKKDNIERFQKGLIIPYYGLLNGEIICECTALLDPSIVQNSEGLVNTKVAYLSAFRTNKQYQEQGYFSKLFKFMIQDLKSKGYEKVTLGVEPQEEKNKSIYNKYGFTEHIKNAQEVYPDGTTIDVEYYSKTL